MSIILLIVKASHELSNLFAQEHQNAENNKIKSERKMGQQIEDDIPKSLFLKLYTVPAEIEEVQNIATYL